MQSREKPRLKRYEVFNIVAVKLLEEVARGRAQNECGHPRGMEGLHTGVITRRSQT
jgi:hypothetical protein